MKKWLIRVVIIILVAALGIGGVAAYRTITTPKKVHYHAGFVVFVNDKKVDFADAKYMNVKPCMANGKDEQESNNPEDEQIEKAHLHDYVGDVVHIERTNSKWRDLFINIHYTINYANTTAYINGNKVQDWQNQPIHPYDSIVIFLGKNDVTKDLKQAVTKSHIQQEEKKSESCG